MEFITPILSVFSVVIVLSTALIGYYKVFLPSRENSKQLEFVDITLSMYKQRIELLEDDREDIQKKLLNCEERSARCDDERARLQRQILKFLEHKDGEH